LNKEEDEAYQTLVPKLNTTQN